MRRCMGIAKLKIKDIVKIGALFAWLMYFIIANSDYGGRLSIPISSDNAMDMPEKQQLLSNHCLAVLGGSNVRMGLSARKIDIESCSAINLGINSEGGSFEKYANWLSKGLKTNLTIYSPIIIWNQGFISQPKVPAWYDMEIPTVSIFSQIKALISPAKVMEFDGFGDQLSYSCPSGFLNTRIDEKKFVNVSAEVVKEIEYRVGQLKTITGAEKFYVRVPPIYTKPIFVKRYRELINQRVDMLKAAGISVIGGTRVSSDKDLFCDALHPNQKGRQVFSDEIRIGLHN